MRALLAAAVAAGCGSRAVSGTGGSGATGGAGTGAGGAGNGAAGGAATGAGGSGGAGSGCVGAAPGDCLDTCDATYAHARVCQDDAWTCPSPWVPASSCWSGAAAPPCQGSPAYCVPNGSGGGCFDVLPLAVCTGAHWACVGASYPSECACIGGTYLCDAGIPDAGPGDARDAGASDGRMDGPSCDGAQVFCAFSTGSTCSDVGVASNCTPSGWVCPSGSMPFSQCRCVGAPPPGCVCGSSGFVCTDGGP
jgi:hypothetical protein